MVCFWLAVGLGASGSMLNLLMALCAIFLAGVVYLGVAPRLRKRDQYDLNALRELQEREELEAIDVGEVSPDADTVVCPNCGASYKRRILQCPHCRCG